MNSKEESIRHMTGRLMRIINKHFRIEGQPVRLAEGIELTAREVHVLQAIGANEGINVKTIGEVMGVTKSAASQMVRKLEERGFARKDRAIDNDKEIQVFLTDVGWEAFKVHEEFHERHLKTLIKRLDEFPDSQLATVSAILAVVETVVDERMAELFGI